MVDDFFTPAALDAIWDELPSLDRKMKPGLVRDIGHDGQSVFFAHPRRRNEAVWIHEPSRTLRLFRQHLWSPAMLEAFECAREPLFQIIPNCWAPNLQVSRYMTGDHYDAHEDEGAGVNLTAVVFLARDPARVRGGDLVLDYRGDVATLRFRHNRLVIFPSRTLHRVTRVRVDSQDPRDARISLQSWLTYGRPLQTPRRRTPQADRPTFLLAEAPIIAAAQAMVASTSAPEHSPEDVYWGAFYLSRILAANVRCLIEAVGEAATGRVRIRRGAELEVYGRGRVGGAPGRIGFLLRGATDARPEDALSLFVETGRGAARTMLRRTLPPGAGERETIAFLRRLLARALRPGPAGHAQ